LFLAIPALPRVVAPLILTVSISALYSNINTVNIGRPAA
jgi:hypothetical protein